MTTLDRLRNGSSLALCAAGIALLSWWLGGTLDARVSQDRLARRLAATRTPSAAAAAPVVERAHATRREAGTSGLVGRLEIPRLGVSAMVTEGVTRRALGRGIGHVPHTAYPGESGNVGLAAHRDTYFRRLEDVAPGDRIRLSTPDGTFAYAVEWVRVVDPDRVDLLAATSGPALTLVTCYPFRWIGSAPQRFVVRCRPIREPVVAPAEALPALASAAPRREEEGAVSISAPDEAALDAALDALDAGPAFAADSAPE